ncbi:hypothetical protein [Coralloluteibacterium thermophilus]
MPAKARWWSRGSGTRPALRRPVAALVLGLAAAVPAHAADCEASLLRELGWRIEERPQPLATIAGGLPCARADLAEAQAAGDLRIVLPAGSDPALRARTLRAALADPATRCAYGFLLGDATRRAAERLQANPGYRFSALQLGWIGFGAGGARSQGWERTRSFGRRYQPSGSHLAAIETFYSGRVRSECGVGRQVAQLATLAELFGPAFETEFTAGELSIGTFVSLHDSDSVLLGRAAGDVLGDAKARRAAALGPQALVGLPGFVEHVFDRDSLDDINNQAENFVVTAVAPEAAAALRRHGGFEHYDRINREVWRLAQDLAPPGRRGFERLLYERDPRLRAGLDAEAAAVVARIDALLDDPFYRGFEIYVHPMGIRPIGYHIVRLLDRNPRTPYATELVLHNMHTTLFRRWMAWRLRTCGMAEDAAVRLAAEAIPHSGRTGFGPAPAPAPAPAGGAAVQ